MSDNSSLHQPSMFSVEDFPASPTPSLVNVADLPMSATCGPNTPDSFANLDPDGSWRKTCQGYSQVTLDGSLEPFSETWPRAGMTRNGIAFQRRPLAPLTDVIESGSWPTPTVSDVMGTTEFHPRKESKPETNHATTLAQKVQWTERRRWPTPTVDDANNVTRQSGEFHSLTRAVMFPTPCATDGDKGGRGELRGFVTATKGYRGSRMLPTPTVQDASNNGGASQYERNSLHLNAVAGGALNPTWVEWLMGYPLGWTVSEAWETRSSRKSRNGSPIASKKRKG